MALIRIYSTEFRSNAFVVQHFYVFDQYRANAGAAMPCLAPCITLERQSEHTARAHQQVFESWLSFIAINTSIKQRTCACPNARASQLNAKTFTLPRALPR